jgi:hypothetical protein
MITEILQRSENMYYHLSLLSVIARKDLVSGTQDNKVYVEGELGALMRNDTWYVQVYNTRPHASLKLYRIASGIMNNILFFG